jgi:hypothetical protein
MMAIDEKPKSCHCWQRFYNGFYFIDQAGLSTHQCTSLIRIFEKLH